MAKLLKKLTDAFQPVVQEAPRDRVTREEIQSLFAAQLRMPSGADDRR